MFALAIVLTAMVLLLALLVAGLLRSHADILKALHELGVGVGDPTDRLTVSATDGHAQRSGPLTIGPPLPAERQSSSAPTIAGLTPGGNALGISPTGTGQFTLIAFLSTGCASCAGFWSAFERPEALGLPQGIRLVAVTKGPEFESPGEVAQRAADGLTVVMSTEAWSEYEVPGSPFFVLVDGRSGRRIGEGVANSFVQVAELVRRAQLDAGVGSPSPDGRVGASIEPTHGPTGLTGPERERANDQELIAAGIHPGDPSLYPTSLDSVVGAEVPDRDAAGDLTPEVRHPQSATVGLPPPSLAERRIRQAS